MLHATVVTVIFKTAQAAERDGQVDVDKMLRRVRSEVAHAMEQRRLRMSKARREQEFEENWEAACERTANGLRFHALDADL